MNLIQMKTRAAEPKDAENIERLVNSAFRPERFFIDADRTDPDKVRALLLKGKFLLAEDSGVSPVASTWRHAANEGTLAFWQSIRCGSAQALDLV